jgi:hypothetical protein
MGMSPNTLLVASIRPLNGQLDEFLLEDQEEIEVGGVCYDLIASENTEMGIFPDEGYYCIYEYLTSGWGNTVELHEALAKIDEFKSIVEDYCQINKCAYKFHLTANFW